MNLHFSSDKTDFFLKERTKGEGRRTFFFFFFFMKDPKRSYPPNCKGKALKPEWACLIKKVLGKVILYKFFNYLIKLEKKKFIKLLNNTLQKIKKLTYFKNFF